MKLETWNLRFPSTLCHMLMSAGLSLTTSSRTDLCSVQMIHYVKQVEYIELQEDHIFYCVIISATIQLNLRNLLPTHGRFLLKHPKCCLWDETFRGHLEILQQYQHRYCSWRNILCWFLLSLIFCQIWFESRPDVHGFWCTV